jgi:predicted GNAT family acetyltransferase
VQKILHLPLRRQTSPGFSVPPDYVSGVTPTFTHDEDQRQFVAEVEGHQATVSYQPVNETTLDFVSTYVPHNLRGRNVGTQVVRYALDYARDKGLQVIPSCWFVGSVVERHPEYREILKR